MTQPEHDPTTTTPLTRPNLKRVPPVSTTKLETFVHTYEHSERLALGDPNPRRDMKATLESWEQQWKRIEKGANNNKADEKTVATSGRPAPPSNRLTY
jgi:hypothetical protein